MAPPGTETGSDVIMRIAVSMALACMPIAHSFAAAAVELRYKRNRFVVNRRSGTLFSLSFKTLLFSI